MSPKENSTTTIKTNKRKRDRRKNSYNVNKKKITSAYRVCQGIVLRVDFLDNGDAWLVTYQTACIMLPLFYSKMRNIGERVLISKTDITSIEKS